MEFNTLINTKILPTLKKYGFKITEEFKNVVRFESPVLKINIIFNDYEKTNLVEIGKQNETMYPLNDSAIKSIFNSKLKIEKLTPERFVHNLSLIFMQKEGIEILSGKIKSLSNLIEQESSNYTVELTQKQALETASKAWKNKDYKGFIKSLKKTNIEKVPQSIQQKYKIAKQKL